MFKKIKKAYSISNYIAISYIILFLLIITVILINQYFASIKIGELYHTLNYDFFYTEEPLPSLREIYINEKLPDGSYLELLDENNIVIDQYMSPHTIFYQYEIGQFIDLANSNRVLLIDEYEEFGSRTTLLIYNTRYIESRKELNSKSLAIGFNFVILSIVIIALLMYIALRLTNKIVARPVKKIATSIVRIGNGDYETKVNVNETKEMSMLSSSINDMSQKIKTEIQNRQNIEQEKQTMIMNISHDFKTPLSNILGYSDELNKYVDQDLKKYLSVITSNGNKLNEMLDALLEIAYIENNTIQLNLERIDLNEYLRLIVKAYIAEFELRGINYTVDISDQKYFVAIDKAKFTRVIDNIINNSIKYAGDRITICFKTIVKNNDVTLVIKDNGIGVSSDSINNIVKPFTRLDTSRSSNIKGFGLGLALVKNIVELHGGKLQILADVNKGFEVKIILNLLN